MEYAYLAAGLGAGLTIIGGGLGIGKLLPLQWMLVEDNLKLQAQSELQ